MRKLLIPLDGSELAERSLTTGLDQFGEERFEVHLLRCIDLNDPIDYSGDFPPQANLEKERHEKAEAGVHGYLERQAREVRKRGHLVNESVLTGSPAELILYYAEEHGIDCLIMTTNGRSGWSRLINGSTAETVTRRSPCPVLIIPPVP